MPYRNCPEEIIGEKAQPQSYTINDGLPMSANITVKVQQGLKLNVIQKKQWKHCLGIPVFTATMTNPTPQYRLFESCKKVLKPWFPRIQIRISRDVNKETVHDISYVQMPQSWEITKNSQVTIIHLKETVNWFDCKMSLQA